MDQLHDPSFKILALRIREFPEFEPLIKTATIDHEGIESLPNSAFAWQERRLFPLHTPEHASLSYLYATEKNANIPDSVVTMLKGALTAYGVSIPSMIKEASVEIENLDLYILPELKRWKVTDAETVKLAEQALRENMGSLSVEECTAAAIKIANKAEEFDVTLDDSTERLAGLKVSDLDTVREWVETRANVSTGEAKEGYTKIAETLVNSEGVSSDRKSLVKLASAVHELDKRSGLNKNRKIPSAIDTVFNMQKRAEESIDMNGVQVSLRKLAALPMSFYENCLGNDFVSELTSGGNLDTHKLAAVMPTLPLDMKKVFMKHAGPYLR